MISKLQSNINFKGTQVTLASPDKELFKAFAKETPKESPKPVVQEQPEETFEKVSQEQPKEKFSITKTYNKAKKGVTDVFKGFNNVTNVSAGAIRGAAEGVVATAAVGVIAKACKEQDFHIFKTAKQILKDCGSGIWSALKFVPSLITKSPLENIKSITTLPLKFYGTKKIDGYLKGHSGIAAIATAVGAAVLALRIIQGKITANQKNADIDHKTNQGHV